MEHRFELTFESGEKSLEVRRYDIHEGLSTPFEVNLVARSRDHEIDLDAIAGKACKLVVRSDNPHATAPERAWAGVCSGIEHLRAEDQRGAEGLSTYWLRIVPRLWLLQQNREHRIFQRLSIPEIVQKVLAEWHVEPRLELREDHRKLDYVVQYGESDLSFVSRLLERAGITYLFDHLGGKEGELVLRDQPHMAPARAPIRYVDKPAEVGGAEHVGKLRLSERVAPGRATVADFDFRRPDRPIVGKSAEAGGPEAFYEQYRWLPGSACFLDPQGAGSTPVADDKGKVRTIDAEAKARAQRLVDAERCRKRLVAFDTNVIDVAPGTILLVEDHPRPEVAEPLLVTRLTLTGSTDEPWITTGEAVFTDTPYRPLELTPAPVVPGLQSAMVVGPPGEEIHTDEYGRVRVQLHWDRDGKRDAESSCWMRTSHGWAGAGFGKVVLPRVDQEVLVGYFEGQADHPVVVGRVYNGQHTVPRENELPRYKTRTSWMSDTSPHADDSCNVIRFEDEKDQEYVFVRAQRDQQKLVKNDETERTGQNRAELVGGNRSAVVGGVDAVLVGKKWSLQMIEPPTPDQLKIQQMQKPTVAPLSTKIEMVDKKILCTSGEATAVLDGPDAVFEAKQLVSFKAGGNVVVKGAPNIHVNPAAGGSAQAGCLEKGSSSGAPFVEKAK
jgi:type VI secretion system secreted protein VgrG